MTLTRANVLYTCPIDINDTTSVSAHSCVSGRAPRRRRRLKRSAVTGLSRVCVANWLGWCARRRHLHSCLAVTPTEAIEGIGWRGKYGHLQIDSVLIWQVKIIIQFVQVVWGGVCVCTLMIYACFNCDIYKKKCVTGNSCYIKKKCNICINCFKVNI